MSDSYGYKGDVHYVPLDPNNEDAKTIAIYALNNKNIRRKKIEPLQQQLANHWKKGKYKHAWAARAWMYVVEHAAHKYTEEYRALEGRREWYELFSMPTRQAAAEILAHEYFRELYADRINNE